MSTCQHDEWASCDHCEAMTTERETNVDIIGRLSSYRDDERHRNIEETWHWCDQYKHIAIELAERLLASTKRNEELEADKALLDWADSEGHHDASYESLRAELRNKGSRMPMVEAVVNRPFLAIKTYTSYGGLVDINGERSEFDGTVVSLNDHLAAMRARVPNNIAELINRLRDWNIKWPKGTIFPMSGHEQCEKELDSIIDGLLAAAPSHEGNRDE